MNKEVVAVKLRNVLAMDQGYAVFLSNELKTIVIFVDDSVGKAISMSMRGRVQERPMTHDLMGHMLKAFGAKVERVIINDLDGGVYYARIILTVENELHQRKVVELDARPSDSIALAVAHHAPLFVAKEVWEEVDDVGDALEDIQNNGSEEEEVMELISRRGKKKSSMEKTLRLLSGSNRSCSPATRPLMTTIMV